MHPSFAQLDTQIWKEGDMYVSYVPQMQLASCGYTIEEAKKNIRDATEAFFEATDEMGTTKEVLEEAGFLFDEEWKPPEILVSEKMRVKV